MPDGSVLVERGSQYSDEQRREAATLYAIHGSFTQVEQHLGIPDSTVRTWSNQPWWDSVLTEVRSAAGAHIQARCLKTLNKAIDELDDRLEHGDECSTKHGIINLKVKAKDAAFIAAVMFDKRQILMRQPTSITGSGLGEELAGALTSWMKAHKAKLGASQSEVIEGQSTEVKE